MGSQLMRRGAFLAQLLFALPVITLELAHPTSGSVARSSFSGMRCEHVRLASASAAPLRLVEHTMPIMEPADYEHTLQAWVRETGCGDIVRWYLSSVDEVSGNVTAEVVVIK